MHEPKRTFDEKVKTIGGALAALAGILAAITQFNDTLKKAVESLGPVAELPIIVWLLVAAILLIVGVFTLRDGLARRSRLLRPEALLLKADNPAHLKGRSEDIERLSMLCYEAQQVHLIGESGAGKSALIQAGLCLALEAEKKLFPIYLDVWGQDWQEGPRTALLHALWEALSEEDRGTLGLTAPPEPAHLGVLLDHGRAKLGRTPLLIFDQFDDYQTRHRTRFLSGRRRTWLSTDRLIEANAFWGDVKKLIDDQAVHCLFATRTDTADGLESVRFVAPQVYRLDRLNADFVLPLLTELTAYREGAAPVVIAPDRGWERLKERLARDLSEDGAVLPVQMKMALQGLASLRALTVRDYERAGGLHGLEAAHVERHIVNTARHSGLTKRQVQTLLTSLADAKTLKTVPRSSADVAASIAAGDDSHVGRVGRAVEEALDDLEKKEILRKRPDRDTRQHVWVLDHDYMCRGVVEAERRANRWLALAQEGHRAFREAGGSTWRRWRSLLSPWQQMMLLTQHLRGRFRYGPLRSYATWSLLRFMPYLLIVAAVSLGWREILRQQQTEFARTEAAQILSDLGLTEDRDLSPSEVDRLWHLATSSHAVRLSFLEQALETTGNATRFNRRADIATQAAVGLDPDRRRQALSNIVLPCLQRPAAPQSIKTSCSRIGLALSIGEERQKILVFLSETLIKAIAQATDREDRRELAFTLKAALRELTPAEGQQAFTRLLAAIEQGTDRDQGELLMDVLAVVATKLPPAEARQTFDQLLTALSEKAPASWILPMVAAKLAPGEAQKARIQLLAAIERAVDHEILWTLAQALERVPGELTLAEAQQAFGRLLTAIQQSTTSYSRRGNAVPEALQAMAAKLAPSEAQQAFGQLLAAIEQASHPEQFRALERALEAVAIKLTPAQAPQALAQLLAVIERINVLWGDVLETLVITLKATVAKQASAEVQQALAAQLLADIEQDTRSKDRAERLPSGMFEALVRALQAVAANLAPAQAQQAFAQLVPAIKRTNYTERLEALPGALEALAARLTPAQAQQAFAQLLATLEQTLDYDSVLEAVVARYASVLEAVAARLAPPEAQQASAQLLATIANTTHPIQLGVLARALKAVPANVAEQTLLDLLKRPMSVGTFRSTLLEMLERQTHQKFDGDLWKMVAWAQARGLDVKSPPQRPGNSLTSQ
ncbi:MAG: hypothetical protein ACRERE_34055 [Candidatus Entotheonellia bacterium]